MNRSTIGRALGAAVALAALTGAPGLAPPAPAAAADGPAAPQIARPQSVLELGQVRAASGGRVTVPVWLTDAAGTPLGPDAGEAIGALALRVRAVPAAAVAGVVVRRAGVLAAAEPLFEAAPAAADGGSLIVSLGDGGPARLAAGGRRRVAVAEVVVTLGRVAPREGRIELRLDPAVTVLSNRAGTVTETPANGWLRLVDGLVVVR